jgi:hypothetical protein
MYELMVETRCCDSVVGAATGAGVGSGESDVTGENSMNRPATTFGESSSSSSCLRRRADVAFGMFGGKLIVETGIGSFGRSSGGRLGGNGGGEKVGSFGVVV